MMDTKKGFTLIELIVVIAILGILVLLASGMFAGEASKAKLAQIKSDVKSYETVITAKLTKDAEFTQNWLTIPKNYLEAKEKATMYDKKGNLNTNYELSSSYLDIPEDELSKEIESQLPGNFIWDTVKEKVVYEEEKTEGVPANEDLTGVWTWQARLLHTYTITGGEAYLADRNEDVNNLTLEKLYDSIGITHPELTSKVPLKANLVAYIKDPNSAKTYSKNGMILDLFNKDAKIDLERPYSLRTDINTAGLVKKVSLDDYKIKQFSKESGGLIVYDPVTLNSMHFYMDGTIPKIMFLTGHQKVIDGVTARNRDITAQQLIDLGGIRQSNGTYIVAEKANATYGGSVRVFEYTRVKQK